MAVIRSSLVAALALLATAASAQQAPPPGLPGAPPVAPAAAAPAPAPDAFTGDTDTWIFSGVLQDSTESFSGTLITGKSDTQFELKLADGATCDGADLKPSPGLVRLSEIQCTDGRPMRALFVPQPHQTLKVFGHVGDTRFSTVAHILGTQPIPEPQQTTAPRAPMPMPDVPPAAAPPSAKPPGQDPD
jgi:hypothetical protein